MCRTPEARYARAVDKLQSFAQNVFSQGRNWREHGVTAEKSRVLNRAAREFDPALTQAFELLYQRAENEQIWAEQEQRSYAVSQRKEAAAPSHDAGNL